MIHWQPSATVPSVVFVAYYCAMAFRLRFVVILSTLLCFLSCRVSQSAKPTRHGEVFRAKSEIDSLIYKLTLDLKTFNEKKTMAAVMQKDAEKLARIAEEEIALLRPVQHLLEKLAKGNTSRGYQSCMARLGGKMQVQIKTTGSSLPKHYTISVPGMTF